MRRNVVYLVTTVVVALGALGATIVSGNTPILGLDLRGGISVVLEPVGDVKGDALDVATDIIRNRVDALGVAEPEISRQGSNIVVDLPGVKDRDKARRLVGKTAELRFRPVLALVPPAAATATTTTTTATTAPGGTAPGGAATTVPPTTVPPTTTTVPASTEEARAAVASCDPARLATVAEIPTTRRADDRRDTCVVLVGREGGTSQRYYLGPTKLTGKETSSAKSSFAQGEGYGVDLKFKSSGLAKFNELAAVSFPKSPPENQVAIALDGVVQSAPRFNEQTFTTRDIRISGNFTGGEASDLAKLLNYGALPVQLKQLTTQNVSPTLGSDQLNAAIAAGIIGLALVALYMLAFYRLLGLVVIAGLMVSAALIYSLVAYLGDAIGLTLTLAGVTGLIVSVGVTVDSYVVYYERLKDEVRTGKTVRSSVDRGFTRSFRTIVAADLVSLIGAAVLYFLAIGSVRGFAFFLGLSTLLDLLVAYFFMHPLVSIMARRPGLVRARGVGIAAGLDVKEATA